MPLSTFMYHDIRDVESSYYPKRYSLKSFLSPTDFRKQIKYIKENYSVITTKDINAIDIVSDNYALITFDDGLTDHYQYGYKTLKEFGLSGIFFLPAEAINDRVMFHSHKIQFLLASMDEATLVQLIFKMLEDGDVTSEEVSFGNSSELWQQYKSPLVKNSWWSNEMTFVTRFFRECGPFEFRDRLLKKLFREVITPDEAQFVSDYYLNYSQIDEMSANGMEFGGHGFHSLNMKNELEEVQESEIRRTHEFLNSKVFKGHEFDFFYSYPNGGYSPKALGVLESLGCEAAFTTKKQKFVNGSLLELPRFDAPIDLIEKINEFK